MAFRILGVGCQTLDDRAEAAADPLRVPRAATQCAERQQAGEVTLAELQEVLDQNPLSPGGKVAGPGVDEISEAIENLAPRDSSRHGVELDPGVLAVDLALGDR